jgi:hypothetical protein
MANEDQRATVRHRIEFEVVYNAGREEGIGVLADISTSGALIEDVSLQPKLGAEVQLHLILYGDDGPVRLSGQVIRHTPAGFALEITRWFRPDALEMEPSES